VDRRIALLFRDLMLEVPVPKGKSQYCYLLALQDS